MTDLVPISGGEVDFIGRWVGFDYSELTPAQQEDIGVLARTVLSRFLRRPLDTPEQEREVIDQSTAALSGAVIKWNEGRRDLRISRAHTAIDRGAWGGNLRLECVFAFEKFGLRAQDYHDLPSFVQTELVAEARRKVAMDKLAEERSPDFFEARIRELAKLRHERPDIKKGALADVLKSMDEAEKKIRADINADLYGGRKEPQPTRIGTSDPRQVTGLQNYLPGNKSERVNRIKGESGRFLIDDHKVFFDTELQWPWSGEKSLEVDYKTSNISPDYQRQFLGQPVPLAPASPSRETRERKSSADDYSDALAYYRKFLKNDR